MELENAVVKTDELTVKKKVKGASFIKGLVSTIQFIVLLGLAAGLYIIYEENKKLKSDIAELRISITQVDNGINGVSQEIDSLSYDISDVQSSVNDIDSSTISNIEFEVDRISRLLRFGF